MQRQVALTSLEDRIASWARGGGKVEDGAITNLPVVVVVISRHNSRRVSRTLALACQENTLISNKFSLLSDRQENRLIEDNHLC